MNRNGARTLLMGGQACVFYGAAEFSRDIDLVVLADHTGFAPIRAALKELDAELIAVPPFDPSYLTRGHALHFRCHAPGVEDLRVDLMACLRGVSGFEELWARRTTLMVGEVEVQLMALEDLIQAKKTQRDKDWPMIRRLVERSYFDRPPEPDAETICFWLRELRTPELLCSLANDYPQHAAAIAAGRPAVTSAMLGDIAEVTTCLEAEEAEERERDRVYWEPLKRELESLRRAKRT